MSSLSGLEPQHVRLQTSTRAKRMLLLQSPTSTLGCCEGCWCIIVPPEDDTEACLCVQCSSECDPPVCETAILQSRPPTTLRRYSDEYEDSILPEASEMERLPPPPVQRKPERAERSEENSVNQSLPE